MKRLLTILPLVGALTLGSDLSSAQTTGGSGGASGSTGATPRAPSAPPAVPGTVPGTTSPSVILPDNLPTPSMSSPGAPGSPTGSIGSTTSPTAPIPGATGTGSLATPNSAAPTTASPITPTNPNVGTSAGGPARTGSMGGGGKTIEDCMAFWDEKTHMTRQQWRRTCQRTLNGAELPANGG